MRGKLRSKFSLKINWTLEKMSYKKSLSIQDEEILMEQIKVVYRVGVLTQNENWKRSKFHYLKILGY